MGQIEVSTEAPLRAPQPLSPGRTWLNLLSVSGAHAVIHAAAVLLPLVYPILHQTYGLSYTQIGLLITIPNLVGGLVQLAFGYLGRYLARKTMIGAGNMLVGLSLFLTGLASTFPGFLAWGLLRSLGGSPQHPVGSALLTDSFVRERRGFALAAHVAGGNVGTLLIPAIGGVLIAHFGWQPTLMLFALPGVVVGSLVVFLVREPMIVPQERVAEALSPARPSDNTPLWLRLLGPLRHRAVLVIILASIIAAGGRGVGILTTYVPLYLSSNLRLAAPLVATLFTLLLIGSVIGPLLAGRGSDRLGRRPMLFLSYGCAALFTILLPLVALWHLPLGVLVAVIILLGLFAYAESPLLQAYLADNAPDQEKDAAFGWYFTLAFGLGSLWGAVLGILIDRTGFATAFWAMSGSYVLAALILFLMPRTKRA
jgi:FSR family fosmidomycin resistance protein-like MFS transporter